MPHEGERRAVTAGFRSFEGHHEGRAPRMRSDPLDRHGQAREELLQQIGGTLLPARIGGQVIDAAQAHQARQQVHGLLAQRLRAHGDPLSRGGLVPASLV